jgi:outer membrane protein
MRLSKCRAVLRESGVLPRLVVIPGLVVALMGCGSFQPNPDPALAPSDHVDRVWIPPHSVANESEGLTQLEALRNFEGTQPPAVPAGHLYDLSALLDLALRTNPQTRHAWYEAQAANAQYGQSQSNNYPKIETDAEGGYLKLPIQFPGQTLIIRNELFLPQFKVSYDLLDFGRTGAVERGAREQLIAANFAFNRAIQEVIFNVEKAYYILSAAKASLGAAQANLKLATTSLDAVEERHKMGLATGPQVLIAKQVRAQAVYDLENARSMVQDAQSGLCEAIGVAPDVTINAQGVDLNRIPSSLGDDVQGLMSKAIATRPDIAAQAAAVRAREAAIDLARSEYYPEVEIGGNYGQVIWSYTVNGSNTQNLNQPFYGAQLSLRWNLFTGFDRYYGLRKAVADRNSARAELKSLRLDAVATVWRSYYDFLSARKKYEASLALLTASQESWAANFESHRHGLATINDLVGAERDLMAARYTLIQSGTDLLVSSSTLVHAVGAESASRAP